MEVKKKKSSFAKYNIECLESILTDLYNAQRTLQYARYKSETFEYSKLTEKQKCILKVLNNRIYGKIVDIEMEMNTLNKIMQELSK